MPTKLLAFPCFIARKRASGSPCCLGAPMPDFFVELIQGNTAVLTPEDSHHALKVLRLTAGESIRINCDGKRYEAVLNLAEQPGLASATLLHPLPSTEAKVRITLYQGMPKGDKLEQIVRQAAELGVYEVVPCFFARCVAKPEKTEKRMHRLRKIAREAAMQAGRTLVPEVKDPVSFPCLLSHLSAHQQVLVAYELETGISPGHVYTDALDVALVIGPEGGLTKEEVDAMGGSVFSLGPRILRTETAGIAAISMIRALADDFS
jgi:16S rRNA (uracil1498-N3)-methyltransferase